MDKLQTARLAKAAAKRDETDVGAHVKSLENDVSALLDDASQSTRDWRFKSLGQIGASAARS
jgi:hypothetical protein